jgi:hypothetical protein
MSGSSNPLIKRQDNPLSKLATYTYGISLYMLSPEAYSFFLEQQGTNISILAATIPEGVFVVAQSGGIADRGSGTRAFPFDVYIDDLRLSNLVSPRQTSGFHNATKMEFAIYEPYGFQFITRLKIAADELLKKSNLGSSKYAGDPLRQHFVLGIKFTGRKPDGTIATNEDFITNVDASNTGSANSFAKQNDSGLFERYYPITINKINYKIDGKMVKYDVKAALVNEAGAFGRKRGLLTNTTRITPATVGEGIQALIEIKNKEENNNESFTSKNTYSVIYRGTAGWEDKIKNAKIVSSDMKANDSDQLVNQFITAARTTTNRYVEANSKTKPNQDVRELSFASGRALIQAFSSIIIRSTFIEDSLKVNYTGDPNTTRTTDSVNNTTDATDGSPLIWFNIVPVTKPTGYCDIRKDWTYDITYIITAYETSLALGTLLKQGKLPPYPGPQKVYEYWYTGKNTEIIKFEQTLDNSYFMTTYSEDGKEKLPTPNYPHRIQSSASSDDKNISQQPQNSFVNYLLDPKSHALAKIDIIGDPDYLMNSNESLLEVWKEFNSGRDFAINANNGQVFIEVSFNEAVDWGTNNDLALTENNTPGLMTISDNLKFFFQTESGTSEGKNNKISYMVNSVDSVFSGGKFTQTLTCVLNPLDNDKINTSVTQPGTTAGSTQSVQEGTQQSNGREAKDAAARAGITTSRGEVLPKPTSATPAPPPPSPPASTAPAPMQDLGAYNSADAGRPTPAPTPAPVPVVVPAPPLYATGSYATETA